MRTSSPFRFSGADLNEIAALTGPRAFLFAPMGQELTNAVAGSPLLTIAVVHGRRVRITAVVHPSEAYRVVAERLPRSIPLTRPALHHPREIIDAVGTAGRVVIEQTRYAHAARAGSRRVLNARATNRRADRRDKCEQCSSVGHQIIEPSAAQQTAIS